MSVHNSCVGRLEVICGPMFSGKSEELIRRMRRAQIAKLQTQLFKHCLDNRKTIDKVHAHNGASLAAIPVDSAEMIEQLIISETEVVGIDEAQWFSPNLVLIIDKLVSAHKRVIVTGLDLDFRGIPFGCMPVLMALADEVVKLKSVCMQTGKEAPCSQRLVNGAPAKHTDPVVLVGAEECYEARARDCYEIDRKPLSEYLEQHFPSET